MTKPLRQLGEWVDRPSQTWFGKTIKFAIGFPLLIVFMVLLTPVFLFAEAVFYAAEFWKKL